MPAPFYAVFESSRRNHVKSPFLTEAAAEDYIERIRNNRPPERGVEYVVVSVPGK